MKNDIFLLKNGKIKEVDKKKFKHADKVKCVLLGTESTILGEYYSVLNMDSYKALFQDIEWIKLSYEFVDGIVTGDDGSDIDDLAVGYSYTYNNIKDFLNKITEIVVCEDILNDVYWSNESWYCYFFHNLRVKVKLRNKKKAKKYDLGDFYKEFNLTGSDIEWKKRAVDLKMKQGEWGESAKVKNKTYFRVYNDVLFKPEIENIKNLDKYRLRIIATGKDAISGDVYDIMDIDHTVGDLYKGKQIGHKDVKGFFMAPMYEPVIKDVETSNEFTELKVKASLKCKYRNGSSKKYKL